MADGGTLAITAPASGGASALAGTGTLQVSGGAMDLNTGTLSTQGRLVIGATGTLNLNTQNLAITSDYTNAQSGSGNAFDRTQHWLTEKGVEHIDAFICLDASAGKDVA